MIKGKVLGKEFRKVAPEWPCDFFVHSMVMICMTVSVTDDIQNNKSPKCRIGRKISNDIYKCSALLVHSVLRSNSQQSTNLRPPNVRL